MIPFWLIFLVFVGFVLLLDLGVFNKNDHVIGVKEAIRWTILWILVSLAFNVGIYFLYEYGLTEGPKGPVDGAEAAMEYLAGFVIEKSLSLDNIFVMAAIFSYFKIPQMYQHRVLFWGILGAIVLRGVFIFGGSALILHFDWLMYVFGAVLVFSAVKMLVGKDSEEKDLANNFIVKFQDVDETEAKELIKAELYLPLSELPPLSGNHFYFHEVIGFQVIDIEKGNIGTCQDFIEISHNPIMQIDHNGTEILIPAIDEVFKEIDRENKQILISAPDGLIDVYLN